MEHVVLQVDVGGESVMPLLERAVQGRIRELDATLCLMELSLRDYELKHGMFSADFYRQYLDDDKLPDTVEFQMWAGEYEMYQRVLKERRTLTGMRICSSSNTSSN